MLVERTREQPPAIPVVKPAARAVEIDYSLAVPLRYLVESKHVEGPGGGSRPHVLCGLGR